MKIPKTPRRGLVVTRAVTRRHPHERVLDGYAEYAATLLADCEHIAQRAEDALLDTAVRDMLYTGLAYLLHVAYDSMAIALQLDGDAFHTFIDGKTAQWFRDRDFAEWFCSAAASGFNTSRPREPMKLLFPPVEKRKARTPSASKPQKKAEKSANVK